MRTINEKRDDKYLAFARRAMVWFENKDRLYASYSDGSDFGCGDLIAVRNDSDWDDTTKQYRSLRVLVFKISDYEEPVVVELNDVDDE